MLAADIGLYDEKEGVVSARPKRRTPSLYADNNYVPVIVMSHGSLEGASHLEWVHVSQLDNSRQFNSRDIFLDFNTTEVIKDKKILSLKEQINSMRKNVGFSVSDLSVIFHVSRPTIYAWIDKEISIRERHQQRVNDIYDICLFWGRKNIGAIGPYLYRKADNNEKTLIEMLSENKIDKDQIHFILNQIEQTLLTRLSRKHENESLLKKHGFEEISDEELDKRFKDNIQSIG